MTVVNYPGPYEVRIIYTVAGLTHTQRLNCRIDGDPEPGTLFGDISLLVPSGGTTPLEDVVDTWIGILRPFFSTASTDFVRAELWRYEPDSFASDFISTYDIGLAGSNAGAYTPAGQFIFTFRTREGGVMRVSLMEPVITPGISVTPPYTGNPLILTDQVISVNAPWLGRDTSYPFANIAAHPGQNEAIFKRRFRTL